ncbi:hypothetical protein GCM10023171_34330 [Microbacterium panaciterrae]|uniref:Uncharacterized protein n=1 Tax=Microbacterium panaciterrae TaxID=985759 RepID=A0ABP8PPK7_9MICO
MVRSGPFARIVIGEVTLDKDDERISVGDADGEIVVPSPAARTRVVKSTPDASAPLDEVWIDLMPADIVVKR